MNEKSGTRASHGEKVVKDIRRATRKQYSAEEKIRIVLDGLKGKDSWFVIISLLWTARSEMVGRNSILDPVFNDCFGDVGRNAAIRFFADANKCCVSDSRTCTSPLRPHLGPYCKLQRMTGLGSVDHCRGSSVARLGCGPTYQGILMTSHYHAASGCLWLHRWRSKLPQLRRRPFLTSIGKNVSF